jgi:hypothetical protein
MEEWKTIPISELLNFEASNLGRIRYQKRGKWIIKIPHLHNRYSRISVWLNYKRKHFKLHRLVALAFLPNPLYLPQINHIDGNKQNNSITNLEWCTQEENMSHALLYLRHKFRKNNKHVIQSTLDGVTLREYSSVVEAAKITKVSASTISNAARKIFSQGGGYKWQYL